MIKRRGALHYILIGAALGLAIPVVFRLLSLLLESTTALPDAAWAALDNLQLMLWPTPMLLVPSDEPGAPDLSAWGILVITTLANITLYSSLAGLVWVGLRRARVVLALPLLIVAIIWYAVWSI